MQNAIHVDCSPFLAAAVIAPTTPVAQMRRLARELTNTWFPLMLLIFVLAGTAVSSRGQVAQQLLGRVMDPSGAMVVDATVTVTNEATNVAISTQTSKTGDWVVPYLQPGSYSVSAVKLGFTTATQTGI